MSVTEEEFGKIMADCGYVAARTICDGREWVALFQFMFTWAIIRGSMEEVRTGYSDRWCYHDAASAASALLEWQEREYEGEPTGWHRHPNTGRRREKGDASTEYVDP